MAALCPPALGERRAGLRRIPGQAAKPKTFQQKHTTLGTGNWLQPSDELLAVAINDSPWEQKVLQYEFVKQRLEGGGGDEPQKLESAAERARKRCEWELTRDPINWTPITMDTVKQGHARRAPGMFYGLEFPWTEAMLGEFGHQWLTKAFHTAGTLPKDNWVTKIILQNEIKVTGGNNAGKFLFEVRYAKKDPSLHTHLFAKVPFVLSGATMSDRLSSSFYKQPMDMMEINTYRVMESALPFSTPQFYYGDISNETTNFVLITERVPFAEIRGPKEFLEPYEIEGPFDKCKDFNMRKSQKEYYMVLLEKQAMVAGKGKTGGLPEIFSNPPGWPEAYGVNPQRATGENPSGCAAKLDGAIRFMSETAKVLFPDYVQTEGFQAKFKNTMMILNAYTAELNFWKNSDPEYVGVGHQNLNVDNAFFWRNEKGALDCGVFDFGGFGCSSLPHKVWWMLNMAEFDNVQKNMKDYVSFFVDCYAQHGGPVLDKQVVEEQIMLTALQNCMIMVSALPNSLKQCPQKEWLTIKDRHDPRIADNVDNKSTLRTNVHVLTVTVRLMEEMGGDKALEKWLAETWCGRFGQQRKAEAIIYDADAGGDTTRW